MATFKAPKLSNYPSVTIICSDKSHAGKTSTVAFFHRKPNTGWAIFPYGGFTNGNNRLAVQELNGDHALPEEEMFKERAEGELADPNRRWNYSLECTLCEYKLSVRAENLHPILEILSQHSDEFPIELSALGAILRGSKG
jgi:hypothetical protein